MPYVSGGGGGGSAVVTSARVTRTSGNITTNSATYVELAAATGGPGTGGFDLTLAAVSGDIIMVGCNGIANNTTPGLFFDVATMVSGSAVNTIGQSGLNAANDGIAGWFCNASVQVPIGPSICYALVSGDISGGNVVLRPYYCGGSATNRTLFANAANPLQFWAVNMKH